MQSRFDTGFVNHQTTFSYASSNVDQKYGLRNGSTSFPASNIYNPVFGPEPNVSMAPGYSDLKTLSDTTLSSFVLADTLSILDERAQLTVGARLQRVKRTGFDVSSGAVTARYDEDAVTPMVGLVIKPWENISLYGNYIEGLQRGPVAPDTAANAGEVFSPYASKQYEIGGKIDFGDFATTLALYQIAQPNAYTNPITNTFGLDGEQRHRGVDLNFFGEVAKGLRLLGGIAYIDSELTKTVGGVNDGNRGIAAPKWRAVVGAEWDTPFLQGLTLTGRVTRNGAEYMDAANTQRIPYWTRLDIGARYQLNKTVTIRANLNNALDKSYWTAIHNALVLNEPRTLSLSATFDF